MGRGYNRQSNKTTTCPTNTLDETAKSLIDNHTWNTGAIEYETTTDTIKFYMYVKIITGYIRKAI